MRSVGIDIVDADIVEHPKAALGAKASRPRTPRTTGTAPLGSLLGKDVGVNGLGELLNRLGQGGVLLEELLCFHVDGVVVGGEFGGDLIGSFCGDEQDRSLQRGESRKDEVQEDVCVQQLGRPSLGGCRRCDVTGRQVQGSQPVEVRSGETPGFLVARLPAPAEMSASKRSNDTSLRGWRLAGPQHEACGVV